MQGCRSWQPVPLRGRRVQSDVNLTLLRLLAPSCPVCDYHNACHFHLPCKSHTVSVHKGVQHIYEQTRVYHTSRPQVGECQWQAASVQDRRLQMNHV